MILILYDKIIMRILIVLMLFLAFTSLYSQRLPPVEKLRVGVTHYIDTSVQRGYGIKGDYISNVDSIQRIFIYSGFLSLDLGSETTRYIHQSENVDSINNSRYDIGGAFGAHLITNIRSRLYFLTGLSYTNFNYSDTNTEYGNVSYRGFSAIFITGIEVRPFWSKQTFLFLEYMNRKPLFQSNEETELSDNHKSHRVNTNRFYGGVGYDFDFNKWSSKL